MNRILQSFLHNLKITLTGAAIVAIPMAFIAASVYFIHPLAAIPAVILSLAVIYTAIDEVI